MDIVLLIDKYLEDKQDLITEDCSFNPALINEDTMEGWRFVNIPAPSYAELLALEPLAEAKNQRKLVNAESLKFLADTDWKCLRHMDQLNAGLPTSLNEQEYIDLLIQRQAARNSIIR